MPCTFNDELYVCMSVLENNGDQSTAYYLQANSRLTWIRNDNQPLKNAQNLVEISNVVDGVIYNRFLFGRVLYAEEYKLVGIRAEKENYEVVTSTNDFKQLKKFEVLACSPITNAPCGKFRTKAKNFILP